MSFRLSSTGCCLALIFFGGADVVLNTACAQGVSHPKRAIEFSETNNTEVLSKLNQLNNESETARGLQDEWKPWNSGGSSRKSRTMRGRSASVIERVARFNASDIGKRFGYIVS